jgi:hypothetical protein
VSDDDLLACFEAGVEPPGGFHQREHVQAAFACLRGDPLPAAIARFREGLQHFEDDVQLIAETSAGEIGRSPALATGW